jgi:hypothetical protein
MKRNQCLNILRRQVEYYKAIEDGHMNTALIIKHTTANNIQYLKTFGITFEQWKERAQHYCDKLIAFEEDNFVRFIWGLNENQN